MPDRNLPLLVTPDLPGTWQVEALQALVDASLHESGALLLRGFDVLGEQAFQALVRSFGHPLLNYEFGSTPRSNVTQGVYTSTEYPAHQSIPLHNEQAYTLEWPMKIWFYSVIPAETGGETPMSTAPIRR